MTDARSLVWNPPKSVYATVEEYGYSGLDMRQVCAYYGITWSAWKAETKRDPHIEMAYRKGKARRDLMASRKLMEQIEEGDVKSLLFYLERKAGWKPDAAPRSFAASAESPRAAYSGAF